MLHLKRLGRLLLDLAVPFAAIGVSVAVYRLGVMRLAEYLLPRSEVVVTLLRQVGVVGALFLAYWAAARFYERRQLTELAFRPLAISMGALSGAALIGLTIGSLFALGAYQLVAVRTGSAALPILLTIVLTVIFEEVVFRGVIFRVLEQHAGTVAALVLQALVFGGLHLSNERTTPMTLLSVTLLGALWTLIFVYTRNLWVLIAHHSAWNLTIFASGIPLSGLEKWLPSAPLESVQSGPWWLTGGGFGPEDSILNIVVVLCALWGLGYVVWRRKALLPGSFSEG